MDFTEATARRVHVTDMPPRLQSTFWSRAEKRAIEDLADIRRSRSEYSHREAEAEHDRDYANLARHRLIKRRGRFRPLPL